MAPSLEGWPTKAKEAPSPHEVRLAPLDTNPVFQCLRDKKIQSEKSERNRKKVDAKETFCYIINLLCSSGGQISTTQTKHHNFNLFSQ